MKKLGCAKCGGAMKKMSKGGSAESIINFKGLPLSGPTGNNIYQNNSIMKKGGATKSSKLAAMASPKNKITRADIITAIKKKAKKK